jgi:hypothetical protein
MLSYLEVVEQLVDSAIYQRGIKYYLQGNVIQWEPMFLDFWREYSVVGREHEKVFMPVLHLAMSASNFRFAHKALEKASQCSCDYFDTYGICKHIVAVCAALEQEFTLKEILVEENSPTEILDSLFEADVIKNKRQWRHTFESVLVKGPYTNFTLQKQFEDFIFAVVQSPEQYQDIFDNSKSLLDRLMGNYTAEKLVVEAIAFSLLIDSQSDVWWNYWYQYMLVLDEANKVRLAIHLWKLYRLDLNKQYRNELINFLKQLPDNLKKQIVETISTQGDEKWREFPLVSHYDEWIIEHLAEFDIDFLFQTAVEFPDLQEEIEEHLLVQFKQWSDFLQPGHTQQFALAFKNWKELFGRSKYFEEAAQYTRALHKRKKILMSELT